MKNTVILGAAVLLAGMLATQDATAQMRKAQVALTGGLQTSIPVGAFANQYQDTPVGLGASFTLPVAPNSPVHAGFGFGWNRMDRDEQDIFIPDGESLASGIYEVTTNRYSYDLHLRLHPFNGGFQPFVEGVVGWSTYVTRTDQNTTFADGEILESTQRLHRDMSWNYGWGAGVHLRLAPNLFLEGKVQRLYATQTSFMNHETLTIETTGENQYEMIDTRPEFLTIQAGLTIKF